MEMSVQTTGIPEVIKTLDGLADLVDAKLMALLGAHAEVMIKLRTAEGRDVDGKMFAKYSPKYALFKQAKYSGPSYPNLFLTGDMLGAMNTKPQPSTEGHLTYKVVGSDTAVVYFPDAMQAAKASGNNAKRNFFSLSAAEIQELADEIIAEITAREAIL